MNLNKYIAIFTLVVLSLPLCAQPKWQPQFSKALQLATTEKKLILLNFSGSDWCLPCISLKKDYFDDAYFLKMTDSKVILVNADFPVRKKNMPVKEIKLQNNMLAEKYNKDGNFPFTVLLDSTGKVLKIWNGIPANNVQAFTKEILKLHTLNNGG